VNHYCSVAGCGKWGGFGQASAKHIETRWWCAEHYPLWDEARDEGLGASKRRPRNDSANVCCIFDGL